MARTRWIGLVVTSLTLVACADPGTTPDIGDLPGDTTEVPGTGTTAATLQERTIALDALQLLVTSLPGGSFDANTNLLVQTLRALPQFSDAGSSADGTVWGVFKGGIMVYIVSGGANDSANVVPSPPVVSTVAQRAPSRVGAPGGRPSTASSRLLARSAPRGAVAAAPGGTVPKSGTYHLLNGLGSVFSGSDPRSAIAGMLDANGYTGTQAEANLATLRSISGDGVFYLRTHGGMGSFKSDGSTRDMYALWTTSEAMDSTAEKNDLTLVGDLTQGRVVYMLFRNDRWNQAFPSVFETNRHYGITERFVDQYWSFAGDAFVYLDACRGASQPGLIATFHAKNASLVAGWTENASIVQMGPTAGYVFDRLLGANTFTPESPHQRPFEFDALPFDPRFGRGKPYGYTYATASDGSLVTSELVFDKKGGDFAMLAPSIFGLATNELANELVILGSFGSDPGSDGKVTIDDGSGPVALAVINWAPDLIRADLKPDGPGSAGNVVVTLREHHSNTRQLLVWDGTLHYVVQEVGSLVKSFDLDWRARLDPLDVRLQIGEAPVATPAGAFSFNKDSGKVASYSAGGSYSTSAGLCTATEDWAGSGRITVGSGDAASGKTYLYSGRVVARESVMEMTIAASDPAGLERSNTLVCPASTQSVNSPSSMDVDLFAPGFVSADAGVLRLPLDDALSLPANSLTRSAPSLFDAAAKAIYTLLWSTIAPRPAYDSTLPR